MKITRNSLLGVVAGLAIGMTGCAKDTPGLWIKANVPPTDDCTIPTSSQLTLAGGALDLLLTNQYRMILEVESALLPSGEVTFSRGGGGGGAGLSGNDFEASRVTVTKIVVTYDAPDALGVPIQRQLEVPVAAGMEPTDAAFIGVPVIPSSVGAILANSEYLKVSGQSLIMNLKIQMFGETVGHRNVRSNVFNYPVELCYGCLVNIPSDAIDPDYVVQPNCQLTEDAEDLPCYPGQDTLVDCRNICPLLVAQNADPFGICEPTAF